SFFFSSRRRHTRFSRDWSSDVCSSDLDDKGHIWYPRELIPLVKWMYRQRKDNPIFVKLLDESVDSLEEILALERQAIAALKEGEIGRASCRERVGGWEGGGAGGERRWT